MAKLSDRVTRVLAADCGYNTLAEVIEAKSDKDVGDLVSVVGDTKADPAHRQRAAFVLGRLGAKSAADPLSRAAPKAADGARIAIADALGRIGGAKARDALVKLSGDKAAHVRKFAAKGLGRIGDKKALDRLRVMTSEDSAPFVRSVAKKALPVAK